MNNTGRSAYAPAEINWFFGYDCGEADKLMRQKIVQQATIICRSDAKTLVEISDELGVAPVYLEDILEKMAEEKLLTKPAQNKYQTNFCVFPEQFHANARYEAYTACVENNFPEKISKALCELKDSITSLDFYGSDFSYSYLTWFLYVLAADSVAGTANKKYTEKYASKYPDEPERSYRITAQFTLPDETVTYPVYKNGWHGMSWSNIHSCYSTADFGRVEYIDDFDCAPFPSNFPREDADKNTVSRSEWVDGSNISLLLHLARNPVKPLTKYEEEQAADFIQKGILTKTDKGMKVNLPIMSRTVADKIKALINEVMRPIAEEYSVLVSEKVEKLLLPHVRKDLMSNFIHWDMRIFLQPTSELFYYGLNDSDYLEKPDDYTRSAAALWIITD